MDAGLMQTGAIAQMRMVTSSKQEDATQAALAESASSAGVAQSQSSVKEQLRVVKGERVGDARARDNASTQAQRLPQTLRDMLDALKAKFQDGSVTSDDVSQMVKATKASGEDVAGLLVDVNA
jgi:hypothetical protein